MWSYSLIAQQSSTETKAYGSNDVYEAVEKAASEGNASAQAEMGLRYYKKTPPDYENAVIWYRKAAEQGNIKGQCNLGWCYSTGKGVQKDEAETVKWMRKAADQGDAYAQYQMGYFYRTGKGITPDDEEAVKWVRKAAEQGYPYALCQLGSRYLNGKGVPKDDKEAFTWFRKAAEQGNAEGQFHLGECFDNGTGVAKDAEIALMWYKKAAESGYKAASKRITEEKTNSIPDEERLASLKAKAETFKGKTLVFKGLYLDMPIEDAAVLLAIQIGNDKIKTMPSKFIESFSDGKWIRDEESGVRVTANVEGKVTAFYLPRKAIEKLFDSKNTDVTEFIKTFQAAYELPDFIVERVPLEFFSKNAIVGKTQGIQPVASKLGFQAKWTATGKNGFSVAVYGNQTVFEERKLNELVLGGTVETIPSCSLLIRKINKAAFD